MGFSFEGHTVLFLRPNDLFIFTKLGQKQIVFPTAVIKNQEVVDKKLFEKLLRDFFSRSPKQSATLFLSHAIVFDSSVKVEMQTVVEDELGKFLDSVPLPALHIATKVIQTPQRDFFYATNGDIYETIIAIAGQYGWRIKYVVPLSLFDDILKGQQISYAFFLRAAAKKKLLERGNFLPRQNVSDRKLEAGGLQPQEKEGRKIPLKQYLMLGVSLLMFSGALLFMAYNFHFFPFSLQAQPMRAVVAEPLPQPVVSSAPTSVITEDVKLKKEDIKIQVLNGSEIAGQAGRLKDQLEALGYANVEIGNAEGPISNATIVIFSENVAQNLQDEIMIELKKTFTSVEMQQLPEIEGFDVSITTGDVR